MIASTSPRAGSAVALPARGHPGTEARGRRERIALITPWHPEPVDNGSKQRIRQLIASLAGEYDIVLISLLAPDQLWSATPPAVPGVWRGYVLPLPSYRPRSLRAILATLQPIPRSFAATWERKIAGAVNNLVLRAGCSIVVGADLRVLHYLRAIPPGIPALIDEALTSPFLAKPRREVGLISHLRAASRQRKYARFLRDSMERLDVAIVSSRQEAQAYKQLSGSSRVAVIENGVGALPDPAWRCPGGADLLYAGSLTYRPNAEAVAYFAGEILPRLGRDARDARLLVTGALPATLPPGVGHDRVELTGWLDDRALDAAYRRSRACVIPLVSGTGTRIKVLEALGYGIPVVSTSKGVEGLNLAPNVDFLRADTPGDFAAAIGRLLADTPLAEALGARGRERVRREYTWESRGQQLRDLVRDCLARAQRRSAE